MLEKTCNHQAITPNEANPIYTKQTSLQTEQRKTKGRIRDTGLNATGMKETDGGLVEWTKREKTKTPSSSLTQSPSTQKGNKSRKQSSIGEKQKKREEIVKEKDRTKGEKQKTTANEKGREPPTRPSQCSPSFPNHPTMPTVKIIATR
ncbi:hypothetical protein BJ508DRAFT_145627 [Ascobolus immersus RN42]|uniref:Uncharacterized protein n=1 Tax=Ascobolus immersus RN42 TaxID=1160509 RepID=A0A3N4HYY1_ASCIM|nr:hypothetical protein BJ508DRAFT_145627 [Ascobolus immersus RN42]